MCCMDFSFITLLCSRLFFFCFFNSTLSEYPKEVFSIINSLFSLCCFWVLISNNFTCISPPNTEAKKDTFMDQCCHNILGYFSLFPLSHFPLEHHNGILIQLGQRMELLSHRKIDSGLVNKNTATGATESISEDDTSLQSQCLSQWKTLICSKHNFCV